MASSYQLLVNENQVSAYLDEGFDTFAGLSFEARDLAHVTHPDNLVDIFQAAIPGTPFGEDRREAGSPVHCLIVPADAFIHARPAVGPLHPEALSGGIIDHAPFTGSGQIQLDGVVLKMAYIEPARLTAGSQLWKYEKGKAPQLLGTYHGIAFGWENLEKDEFVAGIPTPFIGPVVDRDWGAVPCDVELENGVPSAITLVAPIDPEDEEGFQKLESGMWAKRIAVHEDLAIHEQIITARIQGMPVRLIRPVAANEQVGFQVFPVIPDCISLQQFGYNRWSTGVFLGLVESDRLADENIQQAVPQIWDPEERPFITVTPPAPPEVDDPRHLAMMKIMELVASTVPQPWQTYEIHAVAVGSSMTRMIKCTNEAGELVPLSFVPMQMLQWIGVIKGACASEEKGAPISIVLTLSSNGEGNVTVNWDDEPDNADEFTAAEWQQEAALHPRPNYPEWFSRRMESKE